MPHGIPDTRQFPWDQALTYNLQQLTNKVTGGINTWATNPTVGVDGVTLGSNHVGYTGVNTTTNSLVRWTGTAWAIVMDSPKLVTTTKLTLYVSQNTGSDSNDGLTSGTAWKTISKLYQELMQYSFMERQVDIYLGAGAYSIRFPRNMEYVTVNIYGASSSSVTIQRLDVYYGMNVLIQNVTVAFPQLADSATAFYCIIVNDGTLNVGPDVVFGPIGNFIPGRNTNHLNAQNKGRIAFYANCPISLTGSPNTFCYAEDSSVVAFNVYVAPAAANTTTSGTAPAVSSGVTYTRPSIVMASTDTMCAINASGSLSVTRLFQLTGSAYMLTRRTNITGSITGLAYALTTGAFIIGSAIKGTPTADDTIGFPTSISSGTKDSTSYLTGTTF